MAAEQGRKDGVPIDEHRPLFAGAKARSTTRTKAMILNQRIDLWEYTEKSQQQSGVSDWKVLYLNVRCCSVVSDVLPSKEAAIALAQERMRQHCAVDWIEGPNGQVIIKEEIKRCAEASEPESGGDMAEDSACLAPKDEPRRRVAVS